MAIQHEEAIDALALQEYVGGWQQITFGSGDRALATAKHLRKEIGELIEKLEDLQRITDGTPPYTFSAESFAAIMRDISDEMGDCGILLLGIAYRLGLNLASCVINKMKVNVCRRWGKPDKDGVVEHVEERAP